MTFEHLPGVRPVIIDGNNQFEDLVTAPRVLVIGTAGKGLNYQPILIRKMLSARSEFGTSGTLVRGGYEAKAQQAEALMLMRIGGTAASITGIGVAAATGGYTITTELLDDEAGTRYSIYFEDSSGHLAIYDTTLADWVYDNVNDIDTGAVCVSGTATAGTGTDIGTLSAPVAMASVGGSTTYTAGTDGTNMSLMETYESLHKAYQVMDFMLLDVVVPMNVHIDDNNVADMTGGEITALNWAVTVGANAYPTAGSTQDVLGKVFIQDYNGDSYFWWDIDGDGIAEIYPSIGLATASTDKDGNALEAGDFHEANFAYQLANFCYRATYDWQFVTGVISFKLPDGFCTRDLQTWIGTLPNYYTDPVTGDVSLTSAASNGTGMLGNKFMAGAYGFRGGVAYGGFIATDDGFLDGTEEYDDNDHLIDIGKYLSVTGAVAVHQNNYAGTPYISTIAASYGGFITTLDPASAPTNKVLRSVRLVKLIKGHLLDKLAGARIVALAAKAKGTVITDAPTAARPDSDFQRLSTVRIVKAAVDLLRQQAEPFIGEGSSAADRQAMQANIESAFNDQLVGRALVRYDLAITATPQQFVAGQVTAELVLVPKYELRHVFVNINLSAS